jgi:hypothetical protein
VLNHISSRSGVPGQIQEERSWPMCTDYTLVSANHIFHMQIQFIDKFYFINKQKCPRFEVLTMVIIQKLPPEM